MRMGDGGWKMEVIEVIEQLYLSFIYNNFPN